MTYSEAYVSPSHQQVHPDKADSWLGRLGLNFQGFLPT